jgi:hypothetical protein
MTIKRDRSRSKDKQKHTVDVYSLEKNYTSGEKIKKLDAEDRQKVKEDTMPLDDLTSMKVVKKDADSILLREDKIRLARERLSQRKNLKD